jgi:arginase
VDSLDPLEAPGTGTPVNRGISYREAHFALELLHKSGLITSAEFVEVNLTMDIDNSQTYVFLPKCGTIKALNLFSGQVF